MTLITKIILLGILAVILTGGFFYLAQPINQTVSQTFPISEVCFASPAGRQGKKCFLVELALTQPEQETGLMNRTSLDDNKGMLFVFGKENIYPFWMKNTLISLDMIWIGANHKVVFIGENEQPCKKDPSSVITPSSRAEYVLEVNAGQAESSGIKLGDLAKFN